MDYVFIDTSVFEENNFFEGAKIKELLRLGEKEEIKILLPQITYRELINRINNNVDNALNSFKSFRDKARILRNHNSTKAHFNSIDPDKVKQDLKGELDRIIIHSKIEIIDYPSLGIDKVFDKYFNNEFPFNKGEKKNEFPDAFSMHTIENYCIENKITCTVLSKDKDLINYKSQNLNIYNNYEEFLDFKLNELADAQKEKENIALAKLSIQQNYTDLIKPIYSFIEEYLDDESIFWSDEYMEIHDIQIKEINIDFDEFNLISIDEDEIIFEVETSIYYEVDLEIDDEEFSYYDEEDKEWIYYETTTKRVKKSFSIPVEILAQIASDDTVYTEVTEINNGKKIKK